MVDLPRINKKLLFNETRSEVNPRRETQIQLFGRVKHRPHLTKETLMSRVLEKATRLAFRNAENVYENSKHHAKFGKAERLAYARLLAGAYTWPELFDSYRGFVAANDAYRRKSIDKETGRIEYHKGVDAALYRLLEAGMTMTEVAWLTRTILLDYVDGIKHLQINEVTPATTAAQFYAERIKRGLGIIAKDLMQDEDKETIVAHNVIFILYLGIKRELSERRMRQFREMMRARGESAADRQMRLVLDRKDVREALAKDPPIPVEQMLPMLRRPAGRRGRRPINRFA